MLKQIWEMVVDVAVTTTGAVVATCIMIATVTYSGIGHFSTAETAIFFAVSTCAIKSYTR